MSISWLKEHSAKKCFGSPLEMWWKDLYETSMLSFLPVQCLLGHCAFMDITYEEQTMLLVCPTRNIKLC